MGKYKELVNRLQAFAGTRVEMVRNELESAFPEIVDRKPYIMVNTIFMRRLYPLNLYVLKADHTSRLYVENIGTRKPWSKKMIATNAEDSLAREEDRFLNKNDFNALLHKSGACIENVQVLDSHVLKGIHDDLFFIKDKVGVLVKPKS